MQITLLRSVTKENTVLLSLLFFFGFTYAPRQPATAQQNNFTAELLQARAIWAASTTDFSL